MVIMQKLKKLMTQLNQTKIVVIVGVALVKKLTLKARKEN